MREGDEKYLRIIEFSRDVLGRALRRGGSRGGLFVSF